MKLRSEVAWMLCLAYLEQGTPWHSSNFRSEVSINTNLWRDKNTSHEKPKDFFADYNESYLETLNDICNETIDKSAKSEHNKSCQKQNSYYCTDPSNSCFFWRAIVNDFWLKVTVFWSFYDLMLIYRKTIIVPCCSGTWVIYIYLDNGFCLGEICLSIIKINKAWEWGCPIKVQVSTIFETESYFQELLEF